MTVITGVASEVRHPPGPELISTKFNHICICMCLHLKCMCWIRVIYATSYIKMLTTHLMSFVNNKHDQRVASNLFAKYISSQTH